MTLADLAVTLAPLLVACVLLGVAIGYWTWRSPR